MATTTTITASKDTWINEQRATQNYGGTTTITLGAKSVGGVLKKNNGVFSFDVSSITDASTITKAELTLEYISEPAATALVQTVTLARLNQDFNQSNATWNESDTGVSWSGGNGAFGNAETTQSTYDFEVGLGKSSDVVIDIKDLVIDAIQKRSGTLLLVAAIDGTPAAGTGQTKYATAEHSTNSLDLVISQADKIVWNGSAGDGVVSTASNWDGSTVPTSDDYAIFSQGSADILTGTLACYKAIIGRNYKGNFGTSALALNILCNEFNISNRYSGVFVNLNDGSPVVSEVRIYDTNSTSDSFQIDGNYNATIVKTRHRISLDTTDTTRIDAHSSSASIQCSDDVTTVRLSGAFVTLDDGGGNVIISNRANVQISNINNDGTNIYIAGNSTVKLLADEIDQLSIYNGKVTFKGNEGAPIVVTGMEIFPQGLADTRTEAATFSMASAVNMFGGRLLLDGSVNTAIA